MSAGFDGPFDTSTFAGGLETLLQFAKSRCGDAVIGYIANFQLPASQIGRLSDMSEYFDVAAQICEKWDVAYLDLYNDEDLNARVLKVDTTECLPDHIHPNSEGYNRLAPVIGEWMETLAAAPAEESPAESPAGFRRPVRSIRTGRAGKVRQHGRGAAARRRSRGSRRRAHPAAAPEAENKGQLTNRKI